MIDKETTDEFFCCFTSLKRFGHLTAVVKTRVRKEVMFNFALKNCCRGGGFFAAPRDMIRLYPAVIVAEVSLFGREFSFGKFCQNKI